MKNDLKCCNKVGMISHYEKKIVKTTPWKGLKRVDLQRIARFLKIKKTSKMLKGHLISSVVYVLAVRLLQRVWRIFKVSRDGITCPFTLETPQWPYFYKSGKYYCLGSLLRYLKLSRNWTCPITREPFTRKDIYLINIMAKTHGKNKVTIRPTLETEMRVQLLRNTLDTMVGDLVNAIEDPATLLDTMLTESRNIVLNVGMPTYHALKIIDIREAGYFIEQSNNTFLTLSRDAYDMNTFQKAMFGLEIIESLQNWSDTYEVSMS